MDFSFSTLLAHAINIPLTVTALAYIVEKANKCLDFTVTIFFYHFLATTFVYKLPTTLSFYLWHALLVTTTVLVSEYICLKLETAEIKLSFGHIVEKGAKKIIEEGNKALNKVKKEV